MVRIMVLITFLSNLVVARKPYLTQTLWLTHTVETIANLIAYNQMNDIYMLLLVGSCNLIEFSVTLSAYNIRSVISVNST